MYTIENDILVDTDSGRRHRGKHEPMKPKSAILYNANIAGVDKLEQAAYYYPFAHKTLKWWKKLFFQLLSLVLIHAHKFYNRNLKKRMLLVVAWPFKLMKEITIPHNPRPLPYLLMQINTLMV